MEMLPRHPVFRPALILLIFGLLVPRGLAWNPEQEQADIEQQIAKLEADIEQRKAKEAAALEKMLSEDYCSAC